MSSFEELLKSVFERGISDLQREAVRLAFPGEFAGDGSADELDVLVNEAPIVDTLWAWGAGEPFSIAIRGVPGAYFVHASEHDDLGIFSSLEDADAARGLSWWDDGLFASEEEAWVQAERRGWR